MNKPMQTREWKSLLKQEQIDWLATVVMGWEKVPGYYMMGVPGRELKYAWHKDGKLQATDNWNPLEDWNEWHEVEEQIFKDQETWFTYVAVMPHRLDVMQYSDDFCAADGALAANQDTRAGCAWYAYHDHEMPF